MASRTLMAALHRCVERTLSGLQKDRANSTAKRGNVHSSEAVALVVVGTNER